MRTRVFPAIALLAASIPALSQQAQNTAVTPQVVPQIASYAGVASDRAGDTVEMVFKIYAAAEGGEALWTETQRVSVDRDGKYSVLLGAATDGGLPQTVFAAGQARWLAVNIERGAEQARVPFASVAYAMKAADAQTLSGIPAAEFVTQDQLRNRIQSVRLANLAPDAQPDGSGPVSGLGTTGTVPLWTGANALGNSVITQLGSNIGINLAAPSATLDVAGTATIRGTLSVGPVAPATPASGQSSQHLNLTADAWSTTTNSALAQTFDWVAAAVGNNTATPSGALYLQFQSGTAPRTNLFDIDSKGVFHWAPSQTFPGTIGSVTATSPVTATTTSGAVTLGLNSTALETTLNSVYPQLGAGNTFVGNQAITGNLTASGTETVQGEGAFGVNGTTATGLSGTGTTTGVSGSSSSTTTGAAGVSGSEVAATGNVYGVSGSVQSPTGAGLYGINHATTGLGYGVFGVTNSTSNYAAGVTGGTNSTTGTVFGVNGFTTSTTSGAAGVAGNANATSGAVFGVSGYTQSTSNGAAGVNGYEGAATGLVYGITGGTNSATSSSAGVSGYEGSTSGAVNGVNGSTISSTDNASGVGGQENATSGKVFGVAGSAFSSTSYAAGVSGYEGATSGTVYGVTGYTSSTSNGAAGINGGEGAGTGQVYGVSGSTQSTTLNAAGVAGFATATTGDAYGVIGNTSSTTGGSGVYGGAFATTGVTTGVTGFSASTSNGAAGINGNEGATTGQVYGVNGSTSSTTDYSAAVNGYEGAATGNVYGVFGSTNSTTSAASGVDGYEGAATGNVRGVSGYSQSTNGIGVYGGADATSGFAVGVEGVTSSSSGAAGEFVNKAGSGLVLLGQSGADFTQVFSVDAGGNGVFGGNLNVTGRLTKGSGSFKIDHPLDPANKYLSHSFVESPDMMNVYNGNIVTDKHGLATVVLPDYFEALNRDFRYQLTVIGQFAQAIVAQEIDKNHFVIRTSRPGVKVSWQVTGIRQDAYANANRIPTEEEKPANERGYYLHPEVFGKPASKSIMAAAKPAPHENGVGVNSR